MNEADFKVRVLEWVREASDAAELPIVAPEFSLGGTSIRADLALLSEDGFIGVEIKSGGDTLRRLPIQLAGYARCFDHTIVAAAHKHLRGLRRLDLHGAHVWTIDEFGERTRHVEGSQNDVRPADLLHLMTQEDRRREMRALALSPAKQVGPTMITRATARQAFVSAFRRRYFRTSTAFWSTVEGRPIECSDLNLLSRFYPERQKALLAEQAREDFWKKWAVSVQAQFATA